LLGGAVVVGAALAGGKLWRNWTRYPALQDLGLPDEPTVAAKVGTMPYRMFGSTGLRVSEVGFGSWGIGGTAYGPAERDESLRALARAQELGCNFVDTARVYGDAEIVLGEFLRGRRDKWIVATKYSGQSPGITATLEEQLRRLGTDYVDLYMTHWVPLDDEQAVYDELHALKKSGKARFIGVSTYSFPEIDYVLDHQDIDGLMIPFSLLDPNPFLARRERLRQANKAIIIRSSLKEGFLAGGYSRDAEFSDPNDQRHGWSREQIATTVDRVERFRPLAQETGVAGVNAMVRLALAYPLSFPEVSTVVVGGRTVRHADSNFGEIPGMRLDATTLGRIARLQEEMDLRGRRSIRGIVKRLVGRY
jgi:aryl-alcohol dehydrogenase-like predicted oxidoreductase